MPCPLCTLKVTGRGTDAYIGRFGRRERRIETFHADHVAAYFATNPTEDAEVQKDRAMDYDPTLVVG